MVEEVEKKPIVIKKYANRRLYNTATSSYVTLEYLCQMVKNNDDFVVFDAKSGDDITRSVLTQIIVEEESKGHNLLPISFLRQVISFYGDSLQSLLPRYLDHSMQSFSHNQDHFRSVIHNAWDGFFPIANLEDIGKQNMTIFENAMKFFQPFTAAVPNAGAKAIAPAAPSQSNFTLEEMQAKINAMQKQLDELSKKK